MGRIALGTLIGVVVAVPAFILAVMTAGAGHGSVAMFQFFFPHCMLLGRMLGSSPAIQSFCICMAGIQFPLYGAAIGWASNKSESTLLGIICLLAFIHIAATVICLSIHW